MHTQDNRWRSGLAWAPAVGYLFTLMGGLAVTSVGCSERSVSPSEEEAPPTPVETARLAARKAPNADVPSKPPSPTPGPAEGAAKGEVPLAPAASASATPRQTTPADLPPARATGDAAEATPAALKVKRFVVTSGIDAREPTTTSGTLTLGEPIYAFAELSSGTGGPALIEIVFEDESGRQVGHAKLDVPANQPRWRTWGQSRHVNKAGQWTAVLLDGQHTELTRLKFDVALPGAVPPNGEGLSNSPPAQSPPTQSPANNSPSSSLSPGSASPGSVSPGSAPSGSVTPEVAAVGG